MTRVISFSSGKGGVGKSTLVTNLGLSWANMGKRVLLVDGDWSLGKLATMFGKRPEYTIYDVLEKRVAMREALCPLADNLSLLSAPSGIVGFEEVSPVTRNQLFYELDSLADHFDIILLDHSSGIHWNVIQFAGAAHQHVVITTTEPTSYTDAYAIMKVLSRRFAVRQFNLIVTMEEKPGASHKVIERFSEVTLKHLQVKVRPIGVLPWDARLGESVRCQKPFISLFPHTEITANMKMICQKLDRLRFLPKSGLQFFFQKQINQNSFMR